MLADFDEREVEGFHKFSDQRQAHDGLPLGGGDGGSACACGSGGIAGRTVPPAAALRVIEHLAGGELKFDFDLLLRQIAEHLRELASLTFAEEANHFALAWFDGEGQGAALHVKAVERADPAERGLGACGFEQLLPEGLGVA